MGIKTVVAAGLVTLLVAATVWLQYHCRNR